MHQSAMANCKNFFDCYGKYFANRGHVKVIDIGSQDVNGSLREVCPKNFEYVGVDFVAGKGVDVVLTEPYAFPFQANEADIVVSSSCFEHSEFFWLTFLEVMRILKPRGLFYLNAPNNGMFHRFPVDCWRFYPDSGNALAKWGKRNGINCAMLESFVSHQKIEGWNDFVAVFLKDEAHMQEFSSRITDTFKEYDNGRKAGSSEITNFNSLTGDQQRLAWIAQIVHNRTRL